VRALLRLGTDVLTKEIAVRRFWQPAVARTVPELSLVGICRLGAYKRKRPRLGIDRCRIETQHIIMSEVMLFPKVIGALALVACATGYAIMVGDMPYREHECWLGRRQDDHQDRRQRQKLVLENETAAEQRLANITAQLTAISARLDAMERRIDP